MYQIIFSCALLLAAGPLFAAPPAIELAKHYTMVPQQLSRYQATAFPDRIILLPTENPASSQRVNWRTNTGLTASEAEIALAQSGPGFVWQSQRVAGTSRSIQTENGLALQHSVTFTDLIPDTLYAYRVKGAGTWSEWLQFRTANEAFTPFSFIYFGDAQNHNKSHVSRVMREALLQRPRARVMLHAGDLVSSREGNHDNEWGEWFEALGWPGAMINQFITPGNHEYIEDEQEQQHLVPQFAAQFSGLRNGPAPLQDTVYYTDYQGVRFISLNSMAALQDEAMAQIQAEWLQQVLQNNSARWTVVTYHHPMYSVSQGRDNSRLRQYWQPMLDKYQVDLVLQGHDHTYGRFSQQAKAGQLTGAIYIVSVAGPKMYLSSEDSRQQMQRTAEDTQLLQLIDVSETELKYQALTVTGELYDGFVITKQGKQRRFKEADKLPATRLCGTPEHLRLRASRCWNSTEFNLPALPFNL
ncbi:3',5'-cyclic AMP phosphodiesterase CpdA [Rheinheimera pacifica]|uniref:metallophosphoesterase family protein n=1 Tax=Rheinheimera pacifica TaxID=173990 RepID=UPI0028627D99|nr:metallophosphoesterase family protein [Rheinheimera pacifica]MDR6983410.1 3',5'-cyclic AMP phosphodiesterase CpdA [Rheinheimera pacifica]